jgi:gliding motility-associated-like protein
MNKILKTGFAVAMGTVLWAGSAWAQDCNNPVLLCGEDPQSVILNTAASVNYDCVDAAYVSVFEFMTNTNTVQTGHATISLDNLQCTTDGVDDPIQVAIVQPDPQAHCDVSSYATVALCSTVTNGLAIGTQDLLPNTTYLVLVGTPHDPLISSCELTLTVSGPAVSIDVCCTANIAPGQSVELDVAGGDLGLGYAWFPGEGLSATSGTSVWASPSVTTTYSVTGFVGACSYVDGVTVTVGNPLDVPNSFTPNADDTNDLWKISGLIPYDRARILVYDRWGQLVFRSIGYPQPWDGTRGGKGVPEGTYYYSIELNDAAISLDPIIGFVSIIR